MTPIGEILERAVGGEQRTRVTQANALAAVRADRERARQREEIRLAVAALAASYQPATTAGKRNASVAAKRGASVAAKRGASVAAKR